MAGVEQIADYRRKIEERVEEEERQLKKPVKKDDGDEPPLDFVEKCLDGNEVGDSLLYNRLHRGKFVNNVNQKQGWMQFDGTIWKQDTSQKAKASVENVAMEYLRLLEKIEQDIKEFDSDEEKKWMVRGLQAKKKQIMGRVNKLRSDKGRVSVLNCAISNSDPLTIDDPNIFDNQPWLFACANGVIDLRTGEFREGRPEDYLTKASPVHWKGMSAPRATWERFLFEIFDGNMETIDYLQRVLGYAITGLKTERVFIVLYSPHGQNGKGTMMDVLHAILGPLAGPIQSEMLMSQKFSKSSSSPSPDMMALKGMRIAWASETERNNSFAAGKIKLFSGGDPLIGRNLQDREQTTFQPTHVLFLLCNNLPKAPAHDPPFWTRMRVFLFPFTFVDDPSEPHHRKVDRDLYEKMLEEKSGILAWLVEGNKKWQQGTLKPPSKIIEDSLKYREHEDDLKDFLDECCLVDKEDNSITNRTPANDLYQRFKVWWQTRNSYKPMSQKDFSDNLGLKGFVKVKSDKIFYQYVRLVFNFDQKEDQTGG